MQDARVKFDGPLWKNEDIRSGRCWVGQGGTRKTTLVNNSFGHTSKSKRESSKEGVEKCGEGVGRGGGGGEESVFRTTRSLL